MYIVLVTEGKHDSVDDVRVAAFNTRADAQTYVDATENQFDPEAKYWRSAEIVTQYERIELCRPQE